MAPMPATPRLPGRGLAAGKRITLGFTAKVSIAIFLGLSFIVIWSFFSPASSSEQVSQERSSFADIADQPPQSPIPKKSHKSLHHDSPDEPPPPREKEEDKKEKGEDKEKEEQQPEPKTDKEEEEEEKESEEEQVKPHEQKPEPEVLEETNDANVNADGENDGLKDGVDVNDEEDEEAEKVRKSKKKKKLPPLFSANAHYHWKICGGKSGHHYVPCLDFEGDGSHRHHERSCPRSPAMCLVSLPKEYRLLAPWPEREEKVWYGNVGHPRLAAFVKEHSWIDRSGEYLVFPKEESEFKGGVKHYIDSIDEMVPDIDWGRNIRVVLDIGCMSAGFGATLLEKNVITLSLGLMSDQTNLAQVILERGIPAVLGNLGSRRLPFPSGVFDAIHCGDCNINWHSNGGKLLLEMNRVLRPGGYFILSTKQSDAEIEEGMSSLKKDKGMSSLMAAICWNVLASSTDEVSELGVKIYQRPASNELYDLRRSKDPPFCKEDENQVAPWYSSIRHCLHKVPAAIEERGSDWPEEWPKRLETFPDWLGDLQAKLAADNNHWKAVLEKSYLNGLGIDWSNVRNVMDMKAIYGGLAAALASKKVWVMNVVPVHAPNTLPIIYERGLLGIYHDWCEPFSTYPRSYDLLHADHLFSRLEKRCKQPVAIVVEMDRILRPGGWVIIHDKLEILNPLELILKSLHWEIVMTYGKDKDGIICAQKTTWRP